MKHLWPIQDRLLEIQEQKEQQQKQLIKFAPKNDAQLKRYLSSLFDIVIPDTKVCPNHVTPFRAFADAYFARYGVTVWKASRGFGGKSYLLALLGHCEADTLNAEVSLLGGSGEQSLRVIEYLQKLSGDAENTKGAGAAMTYLVKCDDCKQTIRETENIRESYAGGLCDDCRGKWRIGVGTVQPYIIRSNPHSMIHFGRAEYDVEKPVLPDSLREHGQAICDLLNRNEISENQARQQLAEIYF